MSATGTAKTRRRAKQALDTLKVERNAVRAPIWFPRSGIPVQLALEAPGLPFLGDRLHIDALTGTLTPADLVVFTHLCSLYLARRPSDRRVEVTLTEIAGWLGARSVGGAQLRMARESLGRLLGATLTSRMRWTNGASERWIEGWHLVDRWVLPEGGRHAGSLWLGATITSLLDARSVVLLDSHLLTRLLRRSATAARLWMYLEAETLVIDQPRRYAVFDAPPGCPVGERRMAAIADMLRLADRQRRQTVFALRKACEAIEDIDPRYALVVEGGADPGMWNLVAARESTQPRLGGRIRWAREGAGLLDDPASEATVPGDPGNAHPVDGATVPGIRGNGRHRRGSVRATGSTLAGPAVQETLFWPSVVPSPTGVSDEPSPTMPVLAHRIGPTEPTERP